jgi:hypothetical protein
MDLLRLHSIVVRRGVLVLAALLCVAAGCWEEIEYTGPDPTKIARRQPRAPAESEPSDSMAAAPTPQRPSLPEESTSPDDAAHPQAASPTPSQRTSPETAAPPHDAAEEVLIDDLEPEETPPAEIEKAAPPAASEPAAPARTTRSAAWQLGSKLTLAALAHDRGVVPNDVAKWLAQARAAADLLGTSIAELPDPATADEIDGGSRRVHDFLFQQGQRIWRELSEKHGADHAALFEVAVKSNVLLVLYQPGATWGDLLASSIRDAAPTAELPADLWQPLLDTLARKSPAGEVRIAVRRMHANVEKYLSGETKL